jgi:hypothetical protein
VLDLLDPASPFRASPPEAVRIDLAEADGGGALTVVRELLPPIERGNAAVKDALREMHWEGGGGGGAGPLAALARHPAAAGWGVFAAAAAGAAARHVAQR